MQMKRPAIKKVRITSTKQVKRRVKVQRHVHEFEGSTKLAEEGADRHTTLNDGHVHQFNFTTLIQSPLV
ncbi:hypothetical protein ACFW1P_09170 [Paenibacillus sp. NPDC058910]|uniref:hypothetical protein n=1 Tax=unclassified Paenibacillus TaxID=185978 RepID=UPI00369F724A